MSEGSGRGNERSVYSSLARSVYDALQHVVVDLDDQSSALVRKWWMETYGREPTASPEALDLRHRITHLVRNVLQGVASVTMIQESQDAISERSPDAHTKLASLPRRPPQSANGSGAKRIA